MASQVQAEGENNEIMKKPTIIALAFLTITQTITGLDNTKNETNASKRIDKNTTSNIIKEEHRYKRFLDDEEDKPFWANRGKRSASGRNDGDNSDYTKLTKISPMNEERVKLSENSRHEAPFWGNRGRRDSSESAEEDYSIKGQNNENFDNLFKKILNPHKGNHMCFDVKYLTGSDNLKHNFLPEDTIIFKERRDEINPFWGVRGRRGSDEESEEAPFWGNRGRRDDDGPFWGTRGRRDEDGPFWGTRGRRENEVPFWAGRGRREQDTLMVNPRNKLDEDITDDLLNMLKNIKFDVNSISRQKRRSGDSVDNSYGKSFWHDRRRNGGLQYLFQDKQRKKSDRRLPGLLGRKTHLHDLTTMKSLRQDRIYAEQPYYIVVDRASRSTSLDDDPYIISRGKKMLKTDFVKAARERRGIIEQIAKSIQDDPYFAVRGKKDDEDIRRTNRVKYEELVKARELICSAVVLMNPKNARDKRELSDRDRNRRAILKKLAAQLQNDPYFVSRGKKSLEVEEEKLEDFLKQMNDMCS